MNRHNCIVNRHRANALKTYRTLVEAGEDEALQSIVLHHASASIYQLHDTGLLRALSPSANTTHDLIPKGAVSVPMLGKKPPHKVLNGDLLALPKRERMAWIHGAVSQMAQTLAFKDQKSGKCVMDWYFDIGDGAEALPLWMERYPDKPAGSTIIAVARRVCPEL